MKYFLGINTKLIDKPETQFILNKYDETLVFPDFIRILVNQYNWGSIFRALYISMLNNFHIIHLYYHIQFDVENPDYETQLKQETLLLDEFKKIINYDNM